MSDKIHAEDSIDKVAFVLEAASAAKEMVVKDAGIGEDLTFGLYGWKDNYLTVLLQMLPEHMWIEKHARFKKLTNAACILRQGWGVEEFTLVAEGYCSTEPEITKNLSLQESFVSMDSVRECLTFTHVNEHETAIVTRPYNVTWPRKVVFHDDMYFPGQSIVKRKDNVIPSMLLRVLEIFEEEEIPDEEEEYYATLGEGLREQGFLAQWF